MSANKKDFDTESISTIRHEMKSMATETVRSGRSKLNALKAFKKERTLLPPEMIYKPTKVVLTKKGHESLKQ